MNVIGQTDNFDSYNYNNLGISLKKPFDWAFVSLKNGLQLMQEKDVVYLEIRKSNSEPSTITLEQMANNDIQERYSTRKDFRLLNLSQSIISGNLPAYKAVYEFLKKPNENSPTSEEATNKVLRITTFANGVPYLVKYVAEKDKFNTYLPTAEKIIQSLKFNVQNSNDNNDDKSTNNNNNQKSDSLKQCFSDSGSNPPPCLERDKSITYSCEDVRHFKSEDERCIYWNNNTGDWDVRFTLTGDNDNNNNDNGNAVFSNFSDITVGYGDLGSYRGKGQIVIKNEDTGERLVSEKLNFAKQRDSQGDNCCKKVYSFDSTNTDYGDTISALVTGGGGSWESGPVKYKNNLYISITLDEIGEDVDGNIILDCNGGGNPPPCFLADGSIGYSCKDPRHYDSQDNQCLFWDAEYNGWGLKIDLDTELMPIETFNNGTNEDNDNYFNNGTDDNVDTESNMTQDDDSEGFVPVEDDINNNNNNNENNNNSDEYICDSDPSTSAPSCDDFLKEQEKDNDNNDNNDNDYQEEFELPPEEPEFEDEVTGNISSS